MKMPLGTAGEGRKPVVVRDPHDDPLDAVRMGEHADIQEYGVVGEDAPEGEERARMSSTHHRQQHDAVVVDPQGDIVMDDLREALVQVEYQEAAGGVNDVGWRCADFLVGFDQLKGVPESDLASIDDKIQYSVDGLLHPASSLVHRCRRHVHPDRVER